MADAPDISTVGVPREVKNSEHRVAMTPDGVREFDRAGIRVLVETGAGEGASITDDDFVAAGATIVPTAAGAIESPTELPAPSFRPQRATRPSPAVSS